MVYKEKSSYLQKDTIKKCFSPSKEDEKENE